MKREFSKTWKQCLMIALLSSIYPIAHADLPEPKKEETQKEQKESSKQRLQSLSEHAFSSGIAEGRKSRWYDIRAKMAAMKGELDDIYQVSHLYLDNGDMQPPIILVGESVYQNHKGGRATDHAQIRYEILAPARFVSSQLDWYTFIVSDEDLMVPKPPEEPFFAPRNAQEEEILARFYKNGYAEGANQVDMEVMARVKTLTTMVNGIYNYHILNKKGIIEAPKIAKTYVPVAGNKTKISLSNQLREVVGDAEFNLNPGEYRALVDQENPWSSLPKAQIIP